MSLAPPLHPQETAGRSYADRHFTFIGWLTIAIVFGGMLLWSVFAPFSGAVLASGQVSVATSQQAVQHLEGGIVQSIFVREYDEVEAGQELLELDSTSINASLQATEARLFELLGEEARLLAERDGADVLQLRPDFKQYADKAPLQSILEAQQQLFDARQLSRETQERILGKRIEQLETRVSGMYQEIGTKDSQIELIEDEVGRFETLLKQGNASAVRVLALKRERSQLVGQRDSLVSEIAATRIRIGETESEIEHARKDFRETVLSQLRQTQTEIAETIEKRVALSDRKSRLQVRAPSSGRVIGVTAHTVGGVINPSEPVMYIVPDQDDLIVKVRIPPFEIDRVSIGQEALLRFSTVNKRSTPQVTGKVTKISADVVYDQASGAAFYEAVVAFDKGAVEDLGFEVVPGMPVDVALTTESRAALSYLLKPLGDAFAKTFRE